LIKLLPKLLLLLPLKMAVVQVQVVRLVMVESGFVPIVLLRTHMVDMIVKFVGFLCRQWE
jgi:hypothetical protein